MKRILKTPEAMIALGANLVAWGAVSMAARTLVESTMVLPEILLLATGVALTVVGVVRIIVSK